MEIKYKIASNTHVKDIAVGAGDNRFNARARQFERSVVNVSPLLRRLTCSFEASCPAGASPRDGFRNSLHELNF